MSVMLTVRVSRSTEVSRTLMLCVCRIATPLAPGLLDVPAVITVLKLPMDPDHVIWPVAELVSPAPLSRIVMGAVAFRRVECDFKRCCRGRPYGPAQNCRCGQCGQGYQMILHM